MKADQARDPIEVCREEMSMHAPILALLREGERTVPEIAEALGMPASEVVIWLMGMRRYGLVMESAEANEDDFFTYRVAAKHEVEAP